MPLSHVTIRNTILSEDGQRGDNTGCCSGEDECEVSVGVQQDHKRQNILRGKYIKSKEPLYFEEKGKRRKAIEEKTNGRKGRRN